MGSLVPGTKHRCVPGEYTNQHYVGHQQYSAHCHTGECHVCQSGTDITDRPLLRAVHDDYDISSATRSEAARRGCWGTACFRCATNSTLVDNAYHYARKYMEGVDTNMKTKRALFLRPESVAWFG